MKRKNHSSRTAFWHRGTVTSARRTSPTTTHSRFRPRWAALLAPTAGHTPQHTTTTASAVIEIQDPAGDGTQIFGLFSHSRNLGKLRGLAPIPRAARVSVPPQLCVTHDSHVPWRQPRPGEY